MSAFLSIGFCQDRLLAACCPQVFARARFQTAGPPIRHCYQLACRLHVLRSVCCCQLHVMTLTSANLRRIMPNGKAQSLQISGAPQAVCLSPRLLLGGRGAITLATLHFVQLGSVWWLRQTLKSLPVYSIRVMGCQAIRDVRTYCSCALFMCKMPGYLHTGAVGSKCCCHGSRRRSQMLYNALCCTHLFGYMQKLGQHGPTGHAAQAANTSGACKGEST